MNEKIKELQVATENLLLTIDSVWQSPEFQKHIANIHVTKMTGFRKELLRAATARTKRALEATL